MISLTKLKVDFSSLERDPYVPAGFRRKHIARYRFAGGDRFAKLPNEPLFQPRHINPTHGDVTRHYPEYLPAHPDEVLKLLRIFADTSGAPEGSVILLQAQRITCSRATVGEPSV